METRQRYIKIKALMGAGGHPSLAYISADLFVLKQAFVTKKVPPVLWAMMEEKIHSALHKSP